MLQKVMHDFKIQQTKVLNYIKMAYEIFWNLTSLQVLTSVESGIELWCLNSCG